MADPAMGAEVGGGATGSAVGGGNSSPPPDGDASEPVRFIGRLRRWHRTREWGFIYSELHNCDVYLDGIDNEGVADLNVGDHLFFEIFNDEEGQPAARNVRRAERNEVLEMKERLAPMYQRHAARVPQVPDLPRSADGRAGQDGVVMATSSSSGAGALPHGPPGDMMYAVPVAAMATLPPEAGGSAAALRHLDQQQLRRPPPPPPPPPPTHPAPPGPAAFQAQGLGNVGLLRQQQLQQPYLSHQGYSAPYPNYGGDRSYPVHYPQGQWAGSESTMGVNNIGSPAAMQGQNVGVRLLLEPPPMLERLDPKAIVAVLRHQDGGAWASRRQPMTFRSTRTGTATQLGTEWCEILRQASHAVAEHGDNGERLAVHRGGAASWGGDASSWMWNNTGVAGVTESAHGAGEAYNTAGSPMVGAGGVPHVLMGLHGGDPNMYAATSAG